MPRESNAEFNEKFRNRTFAFAVDVLKALEKNQNRIPREMISQLRRSAMSVGANFRAFTRGRSYKERFAKICIVVEEADESIYWLDLIQSITSDQPISEIGVLTTEANEIIRITAKIKKGLSRYR